MLPSPLLGYTGFGSPDHIPIMTATTLLYSQYVQTLMQPASEDLRLRSPIHDKTIHRHQQGATPLQPKPSRLLALPFELRLRIYTYAVALQTPMIPKAPTQTFTPLFDGVISTSLLSVNQQIYREARFLPLQVNTFAFSKYFGSSISSARRWIAKLSEEPRSALRSIEVAVTGREIVDNWRREAGWEALMSILNHSGRLDVRVKIHEGDCGMQGWLPYGGGNTSPGLPFNNNMGDLVPVMNQGRGGWIHKLMESAIDSKNIRVEYEWT